MRWPVVSSVRPPVPIDQMHVAVEVVASGKAAVIGHGVVPEAAAGLVSAWNVRVGVLLLLGRVVVAVWLAEILHRAVAQAHDHDAGRRAVVASWCGP